MKKILFTLLLLSYLPVHAQLSSALDLPAFYSFNASLAAAPGEVSQDASEGFEADTLRVRKTTADLIINRYAAITARAGGCINGFRVDDATGFRPGDTVLMIQMQGASIDSSNSEAFGRVLEINGAGNYEYNIVQTVTGNVVTLRNQLLKSYDIPAGRVQFVRVPSFTNYTVAEPHTCSPWNGSKGGVFAIRVQGTLTLASSISVSGAGFRGGQPLLNTLAGCNKTDYFYSSNNNEGGEKGEGIAVVSTQKRYGRGALANGGGGGNDHNAGGAGGGNFGRGGNGGQQHVVGACATTLDIGGIGGDLQAANRSGRLLMGGGGGSGHGNERGEKAGGAGGGILILDAPVIGGNSYRISANGADAPQCSAPGNPGGGCMNDGGGGGGGGGQVYISATSISSALFIDAKGGKGSDVYVGNGVSASGPGGGGGGGAIAVVSNTAGRTTQSLAAGVNGTLPQLGTRWNAQPGTAGQSLNSAAIPFSSTPYAGTAVKPTYRDTATGCLNRRFFNTTVPVIPGATQASWMIAGVDTLTGAEVNFTFPAYGSYELVLWVTDADGCRDSIQRRIVVSQPVGSLSDSTFCAGGTPILTARNGINFVWSPSVDLSSPTTQSVLLTGVDRNAVSARRYQVRVTIAPGCVVTDTFNIVINPVPDAGFSFRPNPPQPNKPVTFMNSSRNAVAYSWDFNDGVRSGDENPEHLFTQTNVFNVCLIALNDRQCPDTACRDVAAEFQRAVAVATGFSPNGDGNNDELTVRGGPFATVKFAVFNRWGQQVFQTNNVNAGWDGTYRGAAQPIDVYAYVVSVTFMDGSQETIKGNVTLLR